MSLLERIEKLEMSQKGSTNPLIVVHIRTDGRIIRDGVEISKEEYQRLQDDNSTGLISVLFIKSTVIDRDNNGTN
jgi:hypothetical protein